jgi:hypothetical protein
VPFPESALNEEAGKAFMDDYEEYAKHAKLITELYAMPKEKMSQPTMSSPVVSFTLKRKIFINVLEKT